MNWDTNGTPTTPIGTSAGTVGTAWVSGTPDVAVSYYPLNMTLRDWFAGQALMGLIAYPNELSKRPEVLAYLYADRMLAERDKAYPITPSTCPPPSPSI